MLPQDDRPRQLILDFPALPDFTFANFQTFPGSLIAFESARAICSGQPAPFSTLFLSGDAGLGKTHLLIAIGNHVAATRPGEQAAYISCPEFVRKIADGDSALVAETATRLAHVHYFLMDDVHHISGHPAAQEKLYYIYNALADQGKKIVFAGAVRPARLADTEDFLRSRFQWGMTAELQPPDETAMARICKKLASDLGLTVPDNVITYLFHHIPRDFQSIRNAVRTINRESFEQKRKVTLPLVKTALNLL
jgi:chromosomal replication initiator protein